MLAAESWPAPPATLGKAVENKYVFGSEEEAGACSVLCWAAGDAARRRRLDATELAVRASRDVADACRQLWQSAREVFVPDQKKD